MKNGLRSQTGSANVMAPLAECRELHGLMNQATSFTYKFLTSLVDLRKGRTRKAIRLLQDSYLAWNFGIRPLVTDIDNAGKAIASFIARQDSSYRIKGNAHMEANNSYVPILGQTTPPFGLAASAIGTSNLKLSYRYVGAFHSKISSANDYTVFNHLGIDLTQVPYTLWELTAFSWIADYFSNIGTYFEDAFYCPPGDLIYLTLTRRAEVTANHFVSFSVIGGNPNNVFITNAGTANSTVRYLEMDRSVLGVLPHVGLAFKSFDTEGKYAVGKLLNLLSILKA
jgi:hypothetical protein